MSNHPGRGLHQKAFNPFSDCEGRGHKPQNPYAESATETRFILGLLTKVKTNTLKQCYKPKQFM